MSRLYGLCCAVLLLCGCAQWSVLANNPTVSLPAADFAFVANHQLQLVSREGVVTPTAFTAAEILPAVSSDGELVLYADSVADKFQLSSLDTKLSASEVILGLNSLPTQLTISTDPDIALMIMDEQLYLIFIPQRRLVRVHEGVVQAMFSNSNQRIDYLTTDQRLLSREFALDGSLAEAKTLASNPFTERAIEERPNTAMAGWSKQGSGVYYVDTAGEVTLVEYE